MNTNHITKVIQQNIYWLISALIICVFVGSLIVENHMPSEKAQPFRRPAEITLIEQSIQNRKIVEAKEQAINYIKLNPDVAIAYRLLGQVEVYLGDLGSAVENAKMAVALAPEEIEYQLFLSDLFSKIGWVTQSETTLDNLLEIKPNDKEALTKRSELYLLSGRFDKALDDLNFALSSHVADPNLLLVRARVKMSEGDKAGALADITQVINSGNKQWSAQAENYKKALGL